jgi:hypothetical protein
LLQRRIDHQRRAVGGGKELPRHVGQDEQGGDEAGLLIAASREQGERQRADERGTDPRTDGSAVDKTKANPSRQTRPSSEVSRLPRNG